METTPEPKPPTPSAAAPADAPKPAAPAAAKPAPPPKKELPKPVFNEKNGRLITREQRYWPNEFWQDPWS
ncbi:MAG TPA: hypothetical protein VNI01_02090, partial [Elusimicrobiota bacterium]|nr:hypothetical protein [Elusimicrobiota bacterium]